MGKTQLTFLKFFPNRQTDQRERGRVPRRGLHRGGRPIPDGSGGPGNVPVKNIFFKKNILFANLKEPAKLLFFHKTHISETSFTKDGIWCMNGQTATFCFKFSDIKMLILQKKIIFCIFAKILFKKTQVPARLHRVLPVRRRRLRASGGAGR